MPSVYHQSATNIGGSCQEFDQSIYIHHTGWGAANPAHRKGAVTSGEGLRGGVCMGLSALWLACRGDWSVFKNTYATSGGMAIVRGFMNLHKETARIGTAGTVEKDSQFYQLLLQAIGVKYTGAQRHAMNALVDQGVTGFVPSGDGLYLLDFWGANSGHAIGFKKTGDSYTVFDPNYGAAALPDAATFRQFVPWLFSSYYPDLNAGWIVQRYFLS
jgi:YopT-type cysteine protease-like protein